MAQLKLPGVKSRPSASGGRWGGRRKGAGRKRTRAKAGVAHVRRPAAEAGVPMHVSLRLSKRGPLT